MAHSSNTTHESNVDVLIIGAGPAGVMAANALVQAGVKVRIVDQRPEGLSSGQADGVHPRSLEILQSYGLADQLLKDGFHIWKLAYYDPDGKGGIARSRRLACVGVPDTRYMFGVTMHQGGVEDLFLDSMKKKGLEVERSTIPTSIQLSDGTEDLKDPHAYVNTVAIEHVDRDENKTEVVHAKFVIGSDGGHSWVRKTLRIEAEGGVTGAIWGVVDLLPDTDLPDVRCMTYIHSEHGTMFIIPRERDLIRLYIQQPDDSEVIDPTTGRVDKNRSSPEKILAQAQKMLHPYHINIKDGHVNWWTIYVVGQRVAEKYSVHDRTLIAGDACHTHSPKAGQGMNAAMGDTHNLSWKLAYVLKGWGSMSLLKTYESERRKFAQDLIAFDKQWTKLFEGKAQANGYPEGVTPEQFMTMQRTFGGFTSGIGIVYAPSIIVNTQYQHLASNLVIGARMSPQVFIHAADGKPSEIQDLLPADVRFKVLVFGGDIGVKDEVSRLQTTADEFAKPESFLNRFGHQEPSKIFDILCFSSAKEHSTDYLDFPQFFRPHWSKVLLDDTDLGARAGGGGYAKYGIDPHAGAIVVVRPDGYVGMVAPLGRVDELTSYFGAFLV